MLTLPLHRQAGAQRAGDLPAVGPQQFILPLPTPDGTRRRRWLPTDRRRRSTNTCRRARPIDDAVGQCTGVISQTRPAGSGEPARSSFVVRHCLSLLYLSTSAGVPSARRRRRPSAAGCRGRCRSGSPCRRRAWTGSKSIVAQADPLVGEASLVERRRDDFGIGLAGAIHHAVLHHGVGQAGGDEDLAPGRRRAGAGAGGTPPWRPGRRRCACSAPACRRRRWSGCTGASDGFSG